MVAFGWSGVVAIAVGPKKKDRADFSGDTREPRFARLSAKWAGR